MGKDALIQELARFRRYRDDLIQGDSDDLDHHLADFVAELGRNTLVESIRSELRSFDVDAWWEEQTGQGSTLAGGHRRKSIEFPSDENDRLVAFLEIADSLASGEMEIYGLGQLMGRYKMDKAKASVLNRVPRPMADLLSERMRVQADIANPAIRELAGVSFDMDRGDRFAIITLVFENAEVPRALKEYMFVPVGSHVDAAWQIVRALPVQVGPPRWRG